MDFRINSATTAGASQATGANTVTYGSPVPNWTDPITTLFGGGMPGFSSTKVNPQFVIGALAILAGIYLLKVKG